MSAFLRENCVKALGGHNIQAYPTVEYDLQAKTAVTSYLYFCSKCGCSRDEIYGQGPKRSRPPGKKPEGQAEIPLEA